MRDSRDESRAERIDDLHKYDRDGFGRLEERNQRRRRSREQHIGGVGEQLGGDRR